MKYAIALFNYFHEEDGIKLCIADCAPGSSWHDALKQAFPVYAEYVKGYSDLGEARMAALSQDWSFDVVAINN